MRYRPHEVVRSLRLAYNVSKSKLAKPLMDLRDFNQYLRIYCYVRGVYEQYDRQLTREVPFHCRGTSGKALTKNDWNFIVRLQFYSE